jgi:hypothetical protein
VTIEGKSRSINRRRFLRQGARAVAGGSIIRGLHAQGARERVRQLRSAYIVDTKRHAAENRAGRNYWAAYIPEILSELGLTAAALPIDTLGNSGALKNYSTLLLGDINVAQISSTAAGELEKWVRAGGTLIALGTDGLDELCGNRHEGDLAQPKDDFTCAATFAFGDDTLTADIHSVLQPQQRLLIFSPVRKIRSGESKELARLFEEDGKDTGCAAITGRELGAGRVFYFSFNVPKTMWVLHQGRPVDGDRDGDGWWRSSDGLTRRPHSAEVGYADEILFLLQNMIGTQPHAFIDQLPPVPRSSTTASDQRAGSRIPDVLFYWGGDDEGNSDGIQIKSSEWLKERGLPYHINAMPRKDGTFGLSVDEARKILANGHEISIHYNFIDNHKQGAGFTREDVMNQAAAFRKYFGQELVCSVNHWSRWTGWAEPAKWMLEAGGKADNTFTGVGSPPLNTVNSLGFSFGTAFPFWFYDDWRGKNQKIEFLEEPRNAYECGYLKENTDFPMVYKAIDVGLRYRLTINMFYHPIYIANYPACRAAIDEGLRYLKERKAVALHLGPDALYRWWKARAEAEVTQTSVVGKEWSYEVKSAYSDGVVVKVPLGNRGIGSVKINGAAAGGDSVRQLRMFGQNWAFVAVPSGKSRLQIATA